MDPRVAAWVLDPDDTVRLSFERMDYSETLPNRTANNKISAWVR